MDLWHGVAGHTPYDQRRRLGERAIGLAGEPVTFRCPPAEARELLDDAGFEIVDQALALEMTRRFSNGGRRCDEAMCVVAARLR